MKIKKSSDFFSLRVALLPEKKLLRQSVSLASMYSKISETYFSVDGKKYLPHITVYFGKFPISVKQKVFKVVERISKKYSSINLEYEKVEIYLDWLWIKFKLKGNLKQMHKEVLEGLSILGESHSYSSIKNYQPHLTLLRYEKENLGSRVFKKSLQTIKVEINSKCNYLALSKGEEHGTVTKVIKKYKLKS